MLYLPPLDFGVLINRIAIGVADPHMGRTFMHGGRTIPWTVYFITSVIDSIFFIFALICWKQLKTIIKILVAVSYLKAFIQWEQELTLVLLCSYHALA